MKSYSFYKWYGILITLIIQAGFFYIYDILEISERSFWSRFGFIAIYQGIYLITAINYVLLYQAYKKFQEMKKKQKEEESMV